MSCEHPDILGHVVSLMEPTRWANFKCMDDSLVGLSYNAGLERSLLALLTVFGNQFGRFFSELHPATAFYHGIVDFLCALAYRRSGFYGFGLECLGVETFLLEPEIYGTGVTKKDNALFVLDDGDALSIVCAAVSSAGIVISTIVGDKFIGIIVNHGCSLQIHLAAVCDRWVHWCVWGRKISLQSGHRPNRELEDFIEQSFGLHLKLLQTAPMLAAGRGIIILNFRFCTEK